LPTKNHTKPAVGEGGTTTRAAAGGGTANAHGGSTENGPAAKNPTSRTADTATVQQALALLADRWTFLIVRDAYLGVHRFGELQRNLGIARNVLADRLSKLVDHGLLERVRYRTDPDWYEYRLTKRGLDLYPAILAFFHWVDTHYGDPRRPAVRLRHRGCGKLTRPLLVCSECSAPLRPQDVEVLK
jgi:DNA-binding HxlR family transcriptional regulator